MDFGQHRAGRMGIGHDRELEDTRTMGGRWTARFVMPSLFLLTAFNLFCTLSSPHACKRARVSLSVQPPAIFPCKLHVYGTVISGR